MPLLLQRRATNFYIGWVDSQTPYMYITAMPIISVYVTRQLDAKLREHPEIPKSQVAARALWRQVKRIEKNGEPKEEAAVQ